MQETEQRVIPDPYQLVTNHLFAFLQKKDIIPSLEYSHLPPIGFDEAQRQWLEENGYETVMLPGNSIQYWVDYQKKNTNKIGPIQISCSIPDELQTARYWPTEIALQREQLFVPGSSNLKYQDQLKRIAEWRSVKQIPPTIDLRPATLQQYLDLVMSDFNKNVLRVAFGVYHDFMRTRTDSMFENGHYTIGVIEGDYRKTRILAEKTQAERVNLSVAPLLFPISNTIQFAA